ncbi:YdcF family protein [Candidatus Gracilibacteria bacterium]|nr:YdcF family protein [Candidatus Gracilibacteria bacterium]
MNLHSARTHFTSLPTLAELQRIMEIETPRVVPPTKQNLHFIDCSAAIALMQTFDLPTDYFTTNYVATDLESKQLIAAVNALGNQFLEKVLATDKHLAVFDQAYDYLAEEDIPTPSDLIFVFGAKTPARIEKAIELYHQGLAPTLMLSGGNPIYGQQAQSEAEQYADLAIKAGVRTTDIILETTSITIPDNVGTSLPQLKKANFPLQKLILVNSPYSQRRGYSVFQKHTMNVSIERVNCTTAPTYAREHWYKHAEGIKVVFNELVKLKLGVILNTI